MFRGMCLGMCLCVDVCMIECVYVYLLVKYVWCVYQVILRGLVGIVCKHRNYIYVLGFVYVCQVSIYQKCVCIEVCIRYVYLCIAVCIYQKVCQTVYWNLYCVRYVYVFSVCMESKGSPVDRVLDPGKGRGVVNYQDGGARAGDMPNLVFRTGL